MILTLSFIGLIAEMTIAIITCYFMWKESCKMKGKIWIAFAIIFIVAGIKFGVIGTAATLAAAIIYNESKKET